METKVKAVKDLMATLGVTIEDLFTKPEQVNLVKELIEGNSLTLKDLFPNEAEGIAAVKKLAEQLHLKVEEISPESTPSEKHQPIQSPVSIKSISILNDSTTGLEYAKDGSGTVLGPVFMKDGKRFIFKLHEAKCNMDINEAQRDAASLPQVDGKCWIVPSDEHFRIVTSRLDSVNCFLGNYCGTKLTRDPLLSSTSQANRPSSWRVRYVMEIE